MKHIVSLAFVGFFSIVALASTASAQDLGACQEYVQKHCASVSKGNARIALCLKRNLSDLSMRCKFKMKGYKDDMEDACEADHARLCPDKPLMACIMKERKQLSSTCKGTIQKIP